MFTDLHCIKLFFGYKMSQRIQGRRSNVQFGRVAAGVESAGKFLNWSAMQERSGDILLKRSDGMIHSTDFVGLFKIKLKRRQ